MVLAFMFLRRLFSVFPVWLGVSVLSFGLLRLIPGDTATMMLGTRYTEERAERLRERMGLDQPLPVQYVRWLGRVVRGDLGESAYTGRPVRDELLERLPVTLQLAGGALITALLIAIPLGVLGAAQRGKAGDYAAQVVGISGLSIPNFWLGTLLILGFSLGPGGLPSGGYISPSVSLAQNLRHMLLPTVALSLAVAAVLLRMCRSAMLEILDQDFMELARAKGVSRTRLLWVHGLKNAWLPVMTVLGIQAGYLLGGSVVIESVFRLPGIGSLALSAIQSRDYVLLQGVILFVATAFLLINLTVDLLYAWIDPRMRAS
ncbi:MAG: ABC transporter permease [Verrucomicrobia bacterium]|nr:ABC transporter permease [Verrucomicrobiota bacterium]